MAEKGVEVNEKVKTWSGKIKQNLEINKDTGLGSEKEPIFGLFLEEEGLTEDDFQKTNDYRTTFVAASTHAFGELAVDAMKGNKKLERATCDLALDGKDTLLIAVDRHKTYPNHLGDGKPTEKYGVVSTSMDVYAGKNAGQLKKARQSIAELALAALK